MNHAAQPEPSVARRVVSTLPDLLLALLFLSITLTTWRSLPSAASWLGFGALALNLDHPTIIAILVVEAGFLIPQLTLTDVATRIQKRPPWWLIPPFALGLLIAAPGGLEFARLLMANHPELLIPVLWSVFQRSRQLWDLPGQPALLRMRVRALVNGRANVGGLLVVLLLATSMARSFGITITEFLPQQDVLIALAASIYFLAMGYDAWRVGGSHFAHSPKPLLGFDIIGVRDVGMPL